MLTAGFAFNCKFFVYSERPWFSCMISIVLLIMLSEIFMCVFVNYSSL